MTQRTPAARSDIQPNTLLWVEFWTAANYEGLTSCLAKVEAIKDNEVTVRLLGKGDDTKRNESVVLTLKSAGEKKLFLPQPGEIATHIAKEKAWVEQELLVLNSYGAQLESAQ